MEDRYLFLFTVGPVQSYIEQARKTHDLYAGSRILSQLTKCAIESVYELDSSAKIIFPCYQKEDENPSYPNRCVASICTKNVNEFGKKVKENVLKYYVNLGNDSEKAIMQLEQQLEIYWIALPYENDNYGSQYSILENMLAAVKRVRIFKSVEDRGKDKCTSCGERSNVIDYSILKGNPYLLRKNEKLCAVCYSKRKFLKSSKEPFPSNSEIALAYWISSLKQEKRGEELYSKFNNLFSNPYWSKEFLFIENINRKELVDADEDKINVAEAKEKLQKIYDYMKTMKQTMHKYYALVAFDGDSMGKWISGSFFESGRTLEESQDHLSMYLRDFACWLKGYLVWNSEQENDETNQMCEKTSSYGSVIYAGGDDFLGMIPLDQLFTTLKEIRIEFKKRVSDQLKSFVKDETELTISAGICIAHYKTPLNRVIKEVKIQESIAKQSRDSKDAVAISILKRSGEKIQAVVPWTAKDGTYIFELLSNIQKKIEKDIFSANFIKLAEREISVLCQLNERKFVEDLRVKEMVKSEICRLIERCYMGNYSTDLDFAGSEESRKRESTEMCKYVTKFMDIVSETGYTYRDFIHGLLIMDFIRREISED